MQGRAGAVAEYRRIQKKPDRLLPIFEPFAGRRGVADDTKVIAVTKWLFRVGRILDFYVCDFG